MYQILDSFRCIVSVAIITQNHKKFVSFVECLLCNFGLFLFSK